MERPQDLDPSHLHHPHHPMSTNFPPGTGTMYDVHTHPFSALLAQHNPWNTSAGVSAGVGVMTHSSDAHITAVCRATGDNTTLEHHYYHHHPHYNDHHHQMERVSFATGDDQGTVCLWQLDMIRCTAVRNTGTASSHPLRYRYSASLAAMPLRIGANTAVGTSCSLSPPCPGSTPETPWEGEQNSGTVSEKEGTRVMSLTLSREGQVAVSLWDRLLLLDVDVNEACAIDVVEQPNGMSGGHDHSNYGRNTSRHHSQGSVSGICDSRNLQNLQNPHLHPSQYCLHEQSSDRDEGYRQEDQEDESPTSVVIHTHTPGGPSEGVDVSCRQSLSSTPHLRLLYVRACLDIVVGQRVRYAVVFGRAAMRVWRVMNTPALISFPESMITAPAPGLGLVSGRSASFPAPTTLASGPTSSSIPSVHHNNRSRSPASVVSGTISRGSSSLFPRIGTNSGGGSANGIRPLAPRPSIHPQPHPHASPRLSASPGPSPRPPSINTSAAWEAHTQPVPLSMVRHRDLPPSSQHNQHHFNVPTSGRRVGSLPHIHSPRVAATATTGSLASNTSGQGLAPGQGLASGQGLALGVSVTSWLHPRLLNTPIITSSTSSTSNSNNDHPKYTPTPPPSPPTGYPRTYPSHTPATTMGGIPHTPVLFLGHGQSHNIVGGEIMCEDLSQGVHQQHGAAISGKAGRGRSLSGTNHEACMQGRGRSLSGASERSVASVNNAVTAPLLIVQSLARAVTSDISPDHGAGSGSWHHHHSYHNNAAEPGPGQALILTPYRYHRALAGVFAHDGSELFKQTKRILAVLCAVNQVLHPSSSYLNYGSYEERDNTAATISDEMPPANTANQAPLVPCIALISAALEATDEPTFAHLHTRSALLSTLTQGPLSVFFSLVTATGTTPSLDDRNIEHTRVAPKAGYEYLLHYLSTLPNTITTTTTTTNSNHHHSSNHPRTRHHVTHHTPLTRGAHEFFVDAAIGHNHLCALYLRFCGNKSVAVEHPWQDYLKDHGPAHFRRCSRGLRHPLLTGQIRKIDETAQIKGTLPRQLGYVSGLQEIYARRVGLTGRLPAELGQLRQLRVLSMGNNQLCGPLPSSLGNLKHLQRIVLHQNRLSGRVPASLGRLGCIVNLAGNSGLEHGADVPANERNALIALYHKTGGSMRWNSKHGWCNDDPVARWYKVGVLLSHVHSLVMSSNGMAGELPDEVGQLTHLRMIELATMPELIGIIPRSLCSLVTLRRLCICRCGLTGTIPTEIGDLVNLEELQLFGNKLTGALPASIGRLTSLKLLSLGEYTGGNDFSPLPLPSCLSSLRSLEALFMANCNLCGQLPAWIGELSELRQLDLQHNQLSGTLPTQIGRCTNLLYLNVKDNHELGGVLPILALASLTKLNRLSLVHCRFDRPEEAVERLQVHLPRCKVWI